MSPTDAAKEALDHIASYYPSFSGALVAVNVNGEYGKRRGEGEGERERGRGQGREKNRYRIYLSMTGGGGHGFSPFPITVYNPKLGKSTVINV